MTDRVRCRACTAKIGHQSRALGKIHQALVTRQCAVCANDIHAYASVFARRKDVVTCSIACRGEATRRGLLTQKHSGKATRVYPRGPDNPVWTGGIWKGIHYGSNWGAQRTAAKARDNDTCQHCNTTPAICGRPLDVHHIVRLLDFATPEEANVMENLVTLCRQCHKKADLIQQRARAISADPVNKFGPAMKPSARPKFTSFSQVACLLARNWYLRTISPDVENENMRGLGHNLCRAVLNERSRGLNTVSDLCQAGTLLKANAEIETDCWRFTLGDATLPDPRSWAELLASGDHKQIVSAQRTHYLDWLCYDTAAPTNWPGYTGWRPLEQRSERTRLAPATKRVWP